LILINIGKIKNISVRDYKILYNNLICWKEKWWLCYPCHNRLWWFLW